MGKISIVTTSIFGNFEGNNGEKLTKEKWMLDLSGEADFSWSVLKQRQQINIVKTLDKCISTSKENNLHDVELGKHILRL